MDYYFTTKKKTIEGIFEIRPQTWATGPPRGRPLGGQKWQKFFFQIFIFFYFQHILWGFYFTKNVLLMVKNLFYPIWSSFNVEFLARGDYKGVDEEAKFIKDSIYIRFFYGSLVVQTWIQWFQLKKIKKWKKNFLSFLPPQRSPLGGPVALVWGRISKIPSMVFLFVVKW